MNIVQKLLQVAKASAFKQTVALLSHGNVSLQKGYVDTEEDFDRMADLICQNSVNDRIVEAMAKINAATAE